jgi:hypothetical protein
MVSGTPFRDTPTWQPSYMTLATLCAHPEKGHHMHHHAHCLVTHSLWVSTCVALHNAGVSLDDIAIPLSFTGGTLWQFLNRPTSAIAPTQLMN